MTQPKTLIVDVHGMDCNGCVKNATKAIESVKGVARAEVSLEKKRATIWFEKSEENQGDLEDKIRKAIIKAGYLAGDIY